MSASDGRGPSLVESLRSALGRDRRPDSGDAARPPGLRAAAARLGLDVDKAFAREVRRHLAGRTAPRIAVLVDDQGDRIGSALETAYPRSRVVTVDNESPQLHVELARHGRLDLILDHAQRGSKRGSLFRETIFHLRPNGVYLARDYRVGARRAERLREHDSLAAVIGMIVAIKLTDRPNRPASEHPDDNHSLARAIKDIQLTGNHLAVVNGVRAYAKISESEVDALLELDPRRGRVLARRPASVVRSRAELRQSSGADIEGPSPEELRELEAPPLALRSYDGVVCRAGQVVTQGNVLLPETYRHVLRPRLWNMFTEELGPRFALADKAGNRARDLDGAYFHLDSEYRGAFGHALTEQLSRLWAWTEAKKQEPGLKALMLQHARTEIGAWERDLFAAAGVEPADLVLVRGPVRVERLLAATPSFSHPAKLYPRAGAYVHPAAGEIWQRTGAALAANAPDRGYPAKIFCSRRLANRTCRNAPDVETFFASRGFTILYTEDYSMAEQARMFREAEVIGGFAGSGMFSIMFCDSPKRLVMLSSETYAARNEYLIAGLLGHRVDTAWCRSLGDGMQSTFVFDPEREGVWLDEVLETK